MLDLLMKEISPKEVVSSLEVKFALSARQAYRYLQQAQRTTKPLAVPEPTHRASPADGERRALENIPRSPQLESMRRYLPFVLVITVGLDALTAVRCFIARNGFPF